MANTNFNTANQTFRQLLGNGLTYKVPSFQRDYSWTAEEWDDLWQDVISLFDDDPEPSHYMGYLVLQSDDSKDFDIIDGQQRMTTLSIIVLASLSILNDLALQNQDPDDNKRRLEQLRSNYIGYLDPVTLIPRTKLKLNRHNDQFYQNYLVPLEPLPQRGLRSSEHQLRKAFVWFKDKIKGFASGNGQELAKFIDSIVDKLFFTVITVSDELNAFKVFETLNARGVRLSSTDLLKNYLFSVVNNEGPHENEIKNLEERWERIVGTLGSESFPEFLRVFWNSRRRLVRKTDLFKTVRKEIQTRADAFELIRDLDKYANIYAAIRDPHDKTWSSKEQQYLKLLKMFYVKQPFAVLLAAHEKFYQSDPDSFTKILRAITIISFRYNVICNFQSNEQERKYNSIAVELTSGKIQTASQVLGRLKENYPEDARFKSSFMEKEFKTTNSRNKQVVRYILFELEKHLTGQTFDTESDKYNIEHIMPENPDESWAGLDENQHSKYIYRLGNMTLMETGPNRDIGNCSFAEKLTNYRSSPFGITKKIAEEYSAWNPEKIEARQNWMSRQAASIWKVSF
jgi:uncharacterized protein with ParB-like and HNH nuclease domain